MKWRKLIELSTSSSPPKAAARSSRPARRRTTFEALENRKLFAVDLGEVDVSAFEEAEVNFAEMFSKELSSISHIELADTKFDETAEMNIEPDFWSLGAPLENPEVMMMTFRSNDVTDELDLSNSEEALDDPEFGLPVMYMTGVSDGLEDVEIRTLDTGVDLVDEVISDEDLIFYTLSPGPEVETTSVDVTLTAEDVNGDGNVTALDMLLVFNALNSYGAMPSSQLVEQPEVAATASNWDINRDGYVTPLDALLLANYFNNGTPVTTLESSQDASLVAPMVSRIRNPVDEELVDEDASQFDELT